MVHREVVCDPMHDEELKGQFFTLLPGLIQPPCQALANDKVSSSRRSE
jgi:hypothetical protein